MNIKYSEGNNGGNFRLKDSDWFSLEKAGWKVDFHKENDPLVYKDKLGVPRFFGAIANSCSKDFETPGEAMKEFERITGQDVMDDGCRCCSPPHTFSWGKESVSGIRCGDHLFETFSTLSKRQLLELLESKK